MERILMGYFSEGIEKETLSMLEDEPGVDMDRVTMFKSKFARYPVQSDRVASDSLTKLAKATILTLALGAFAAFLGSFLTQSFLSPAVMPIGTLGGLALGLIGGVIYASYWLMKDEEAHTMTANPFKPDVGTVIAIPTEMTRVTRLAERLRKSGADKVRYGAPL